VRLAVQAREISVVNADAKAKMPTWSELVIAIQCAILVGLTVLGPGHAVEPGARAAIEATLMLSAVTSGGLLVATFTRTRRLADLLLLDALVTLSLTDFVYSVAPAVANSTGFESGGDVRLACTLIVALAFAAAAFTRRTTTLESGRAQLALGVAALAVMLAGLLGERVSAQRDAGGWHHLGTSGSASHPLALAVQVAATALLLGSAVQLLRRRPAGETSCGALAGALMMLAGTRLEYLMMPAVATNWITPREGVRLAAYGLLLLSAYSRYAQTRRAQAYAAISSERERIARDLHDGLVQDLACIVQQGQRIGTELGADHPLVVAARSALAVSRATIADLGASAAPTTEAALRVIAGELEHRFGVQVEVRIEADAASGAGDDLAPAQREHVVRIAREAIVNAALHGEARHVSVALAIRRRALVLRVSDDGCGIGETQKPGWGIRTMGARAAALGGQLDVRRRQHCGTDLEVLVMTPADRHAGTEWQRHAA
jgi:signal transduction histidine kinase